MSIWCTAPRTVLTAVLVAGLCVVIALRVDSVVAANDGGQLSILVMGDSYSAGNGAGSYVGPGKCYRSKNNYARAYERAVEKSGQPATLTNVACSGAVTMDFFGRQKKRNVPAQLPAVTEDYDVIFLTIGGNDLNFADIVKHCLVEAKRSAKDCEPLLKDAERMIAGTFHGSSLEARIASILSLIKTAADSRAKIVLLGYPYLEGDPKFEMRTRGVFRRRVVKVGQRIRALGHEGDNVARRIVHQLNQTTAGNSFAFVSTQDLFAGKDSKAHDGSKRRNHELFAAKQNRYRWLVDPKIRGGNLTVSTDTYYHPNFRGWQEEAGLLMRTAGIPKRDINPGPDPHGSSPHPPGPGGGVGNNPQPQPPGPAPPPPPLPAGNGPIVFMSTRPGNFEIYSMAADGFGQTRLTSNAGTGITNFFNNDWHPVYSPDGRTIAFASNRGDAGVVDGNFKIYTMAANGSGQMQITTNDGGNGSGDFEPAFSPAGTRIAFRRGHDASSEIYTVATDGSDGKRLTSNAVGDSQPVFSPDGTRIAFTRKGDGQFNAAIYTMAADGSDEKQLTNTDAATEPNTDTFPSYSPDGTKIAFTSDRDGRGGTEIYIMAADGSEQLRLTTRPVSSDTGAGQPAFSPDGTKIAFARVMEPTADDYASHRNEIYTMAIDGSNWTRLTFNQGPGGSGFDGEPNWGPG
jgi:Tol biopolymer transport system component/lysophospholipase L1-like esterase